MVVDTIASIDDRIVERLRPSPPDPPVRLHEFYSPSFMAEHTAFDSYGAFCEAGPPALARGHDPASVSDAALDRHVAATTDFDSWREMQNRAAHLAAIDRLAV